MNARDQIGGDTPSLVDLVLPALAVMIATALGSTFGGVVRFPQSGSAILFPPYAALVTALLVAPPRRWWLFLLASLAGHLLQPSAGASLAFVASTELANWTRALVAVVGLRRLGQARPRFDTLEGTAVFLVVAGAVAPALGAVVGTAVILAFDRAGPGPDPYWRVWCAWFLSNVIIGITLLPLLLVATEHARARRRVAARRVGEALLLATGLALVAGAALVDRGAGLAGLPVRLYAPLPFLIWAAMRLGPGVTSASLLVVTASAVVGVVNGWGPFARTPSDDGVLSLYLFLVFTSVPCLLLAALVREREHVLGALREGQDRYLLATGAGAVGVWDWTLATDAMYVDPALKRAIGYAPHEIRDRMDDWRRRVHPADRDRLAEATRAYLAGETSTFEVEHRMLHRDGGTRWFLCRAAAVRALDGTPLRLVGTDTDITERRRAQTALREGEDRMALAAASANLGFWGANLETGAIWVSDHARRIWGFSPDAEPTFDDYFALLHPQDRDRARVEYQTAIERRSQYDAEFRIVRGDGEVRWLTVSGKLEFDDGGAPLQLAGVVIDATGRKQAEVEAQERRRELAHLGRVAMLGQLSGALAHELRQPLTAILANAQAAQHLLRMQPPDLDEVHDILADIAHDDARAGEVIGRLRALLKKEGVPFERLRLDEVLEEGIDIAHGELMSRGVMVVRELEPSLPLVYGDRVELQQVFMNLVLNACEAMTERLPAERRITVGTAVGDSGYVVAYVVDRGTGIAADRLEQVFEPFVTSKVGGLGLGLAICRSIATSHRGRLWAANNAEGGATFYLSLPPSPMIIPAPLLPEVGERRSVRV